MGIDVRIDKLTPCLEEVTTGKIFKTSFSIAKREDLTGLQEKGWSFDWADREIKDSLVYKLTLENDSTIQGLVSVQIDKKQYAIYIPIVESAPHNMGKAKVYNGVGGHLFAIAIKLSLELGFGGFIYMNAKNPDLVNHYIETLGAKHVKTRYHEFRMVVLEEDAQKVVEKYTLEGDLNVEQ